MIAYSIIIVNYRQPQLTVDCLRTIFANGHASDFEVIVVDNDSRDGSREIVCGQFPQVRWIQSDHNSGFARGNNAGIREAKGGVVLLLNSDTLNEGDAIAQCYHRLANSQHVAAGVQLLNLDRSPQISGNYFMRGGINHLMALPYLGRVIRAVGLGLRVKKTNIAEAKEQVDVDWINGAFLMVKRDAIDKAGLLDEDFFLYSEEIEWCYRIGKIGKLCVYGDLHVVHLQGASANEAFNSAGQGYMDLSDRKGYQILLSGMVRIRKQFGVGWFMVHLFAHLFTIPVYFVITVLRSILFPGRIAREWKGWWGYSVNVFRVVGHSFRILRNRPHFYKVL